MDFLQSAAVLVPALAGVAMTVYCGEADILARFEAQYCFSPQIQAPYTAAGLRAFLEGCGEDWVYELAEPLGTRLVVFAWEGRYVLLGPYVEEGWSENEARALLVKLGGSQTDLPPYKAYRCRLPIARREYVCSAARLVAEHLDGGGQSREVRTIYAQAGEGTAALAYPSDYEDSAVVNRRYAVEDRFVAAISRGDRDAAMGALKEIRAVSSDLRFMSDELRDQIAGASTLRTLVRMGAKQAGLSAVRIDSISQEYAQKMQHAASNGELNSYIAGVVERFCAEIRELHSANCSACVRLAIDYLESNLSRQVTIEELARAARVNRHQLTGAFGREVGMTVKEYLAKRRCEIAAALLQEGGASVQEIAAFVGYPDNNYFTKVFKAVYGVPPSLFRSGHGKVEK